MEIHIQIQPCTDLDMKKLASFTFNALQAAPESRSEDRTIKRVEESLQEIWDYGKSVIFTAHSKGKLAGWLCLLEVSTDMMYIDSWNPIIHPDFNEDDIASALIKKSIHYTRNQGRKRLEIFFMGMTEKVLPPGFTFRPLVAVSNDEIYKCYYETFMTSGDHRFLDQTDEQKRGNFEVFFDRSNRIEEDASLLLYYGERIVGFIIIIFREEGGFINGIGIHPDFRRRGLGKALMLSSMKRAAKNGMKTMILEVDIENYAAINLYRHVGFKKTQGSISHILKVEEPP